MLAERLDEGLELLEQYWSGATVNHQGRHYRVDDVTLLPATVQRPRPPIWIAGYWPNRRPMRRAARWDGVVPLFANARHGELPAVDELRKLIDYVNRHRNDRADSTYDVVVGGASPGDPAAAAQLVAPLAEAGATWWDERQVPSNDAFRRLEPVLQRVQQGPPAL